MLEKGNGFQMAKLILEIEVPDVGSALYRFEMAASVARTKLLDALKGRTFRDWEMKAEMAERVTGARGETFMWRWLPEGVDGPEDHARHVPDPLVALVKVSRAVAIHRGGVMGQLMMNEVMVSAVALDGVEHHDRFVMTEEQAKLGPKFELALKEAAASVLRRVTTDEVDMSWHPNYIKRANEGKKHLETQADADARDQREHEQDHRYGAMGDMPTSDAIYREQEALFKEAYVVDETAKIQEASRHIPVSGQVIGRDKDHEQDETPITDCAQRVKEELVANGIGVACGISGIRRDGYRQVRAEMMYVGVDIFTEKQLSYLALAIDAYNRAEATLDADGNKVG